MLACFRLARCLGDPSMKNRIVFLAACALSGLALQPACGDDGGTGGNGTTATSTSTSVSSSSGSTASSTAASTSGGVGGGCFEQYGPAGEMPPNNGCTDPNDDCSCIGCLDDGV